MTTRTDVLLVGGGIMSATLASLLRRLQPSWSIYVAEKEAAEGTESSDAWNNAGTGHSALCELNYMPAGPGGTLSAGKAEQINAQFQMSREFWSALVEEGSIPDPSTFIAPTPHMTFVQGEANVSYLRRRFDLLRGLPLFDGLEFSSDPHRIATWAPVLMEGRTEGSPVAATWSPAGTDVDFGSLTRLLIADAESAGVVVERNHRVTALNQEEGGRWIADIKGPGSRIRVSARFVFVGAGGAALTLLQEAGIPEIRGYGGFPISGQFLRTFAPAIVERHNAKVYGQAAVGAPPMSVPHLDARTIQGRRSVLFGPYAGFSPKYLKSGSLLDLPRSIRTHNLPTMIAVARDNVDLMTYLVGEVIAGQRSRASALRDFVPEARPADWELINAGQRVQVMKSDPRRGGVLQFGTEIVSSADGTIAGLLGASPGASTAVAAMIDILRIAFPSRFPAWTEELHRLVPSLTAPLTTDRLRAAASLQRTARTLCLERSPLDVLARKEPA
jgi:malate dehydrogenase (quinone)